MSGSTQTPGLNSHIPFALGQVVITRSAIARLQGMSLSPFPYLTRHRRNDWGDLCSEDKELNDLAVTTGEGRLFSSYHLSAGDEPEKLWIITEADRSVTTVLLPSDY